MNHHSPIPNRTPVPTPTPSRAPIPNLTPKPTHSRLDILERIRHLDKCRKVILDARAFLIKDIARMEARLAELVVPYPISWSLFGIVNIYLSLR